MIGHTHDGGPCWRCNPYPAYRQRSVMNADAAERAVKYGPTVAVPSEWFTPEKETPVSETRIVKSRYGKSIQTRADDSEVVLQIDDNPDALLSKATARELALNLLIATGDALPDTGLTVNTYGEVGVLGGSKFNPTSEGFDEAASEAAALLITAVQGPAFVAAEQERCFQDTRLLEVGKLAEIAAAGAAHISPAHMTAATRLYDAGVRAPEAA